MAVLYPRATNGPITAIITRVFQMLLKADWLRRSQFSMAAGPALIVTQVLLLATLLLVVALASGPNAWEYDTNTEVLRPVADDTDSVALASVDSFGRYSGYFYRDLELGRATSFVGLFDPDASPKIITQFDEPSGGYTSDLNDPSFVDLQNNVTIGDVLCTQNGRPGLYNPVFGKLSVGPLGLRQRGWHGNPRRKARAFHVAPNLGRTHAQFVKPTTT